MNYLIEDNFNNSSDVFKEYSSVSNSIIISFLNFGFNTFLDM